MATPFKPFRGQNKKLTATTTSQSVTVGLGSKSLRVCNQGTVAIYFVAFNSTDEAGKTCTNTETPVNPGASVVVEKRLTDNTVAYLADSTTAVIHIQPGEGGI